MNLVGMQWVSRYTNEKIVIICPHPKGVAPGQRLKYGESILKVGERMAMKLTSSRLCLIAFGI